MGLGREMVRTYFISNVSIQTNILNFFLHLLGKHLCHIN